MLNERINKFKELTGLKKDESENTNEKEKEN